MSASADMAAYMRAYRELIDSGAHIPKARHGGPRRVRRHQRLTVLRPLPGVPAGHCLFCALETLEDDQVCVTCRHELEAAR